VLGRLLADVLPYASRTDHPGYFAFVPSFTTWPAALAELAAAAANPYCGAWMESAGPAQVELQVIDWFRDWLGMPDSTSGVLVTGGSAANLTALLVARDAAGGPSDEEIVYVSDQAHSSLARTAGHGAAAAPGAGAAHRRPLAAAARVGDRRRARRP
jgi:glutamate/tyrosine decarboxylase-like PLP-dependent enzyme